MSKGDGNGRPSLCHAARTAQDKDKDKSSGKASSLATVPISTTTRRTSPIETDQTYEKYGKGGWKETYPKDQNKTTAQKGMAVAKEFGNKVSQGLFSQGAPNKCSSSSSTSSSSQLESVLNCAVALIPVVAAEEEAKARKDNDKGQNDDKDKKNLVFGEKEKKDEFFLVNDKDKESDKDKDGKDS